MAMLRMRMRKRIEMGRVVSMRRTEMRVIVRIKIVEIYTLSMVFSFLM
jgi:hypothetical protein